MIDSHQSAAPGDLQPQRSTYARFAGLSGPGLAWISFFLLVPLLSILVISFLSRGENGEILRPFTFENYRRFAGYGLLGYDPLYPLIIARSLVLALATTLVCIATGLPLAFFIAHLSPQGRTLALTMVVIPLWTNLLIRTYAWQILLAPDSFISRLASGTGWLQPGQSLYPGTWAVYVGMVCDFLPFLVLPLYTSVEKIDWSQVEAAMDLGANRLKAFRHAILPQIMPGLVAGVILVFIPAAGQFVIPDLLGGAKTILLGNLIQQEFGPSRDWPFGSAITVLVMILVLAALLLYSRYTNKRGEPYLMLYEENLSLPLAGQFHALLVSLRAPRRGHRVLL